MDEWVFPFCGSVLCDDGKMRPMRASFPRSAQETGLA